MPRNPLQDPPAPTLVSWRRRLLHRLFPEFTGSGRDYAVIVFWLLIVGVSLTHLFVLKAAYEAPPPLVAEEGSPGDDGDSGWPGYYNPRQPRNDSPLLDTVASPSSFDHDPREALFARYNDRSEAAVLLRRLLAGDYDYEDEVLTGRFLKHVDRYWEFLQNVTLTSIRTIRRRPSSVHVEVPYYSDDDPLGLPWKAHIRLVKRTDGWRVEHIRIIRVNNAVF